MTERNKTYYWQNRQRESLRAKQRSAMITRVLYSIKNKPCMDCEGWFDPCQMQFDHRDPTTKDGEIGALRGQRSLKNLLLEIKKCDIVCANCHCLRTRRQQRLKIIPTFGRR